MAKPIKDNPTIRGKAARQIRKMLLSQPTPSPKKIEQDKRDIEIYTANLVVERLKNENSRETHQ